MTNPTPPQPVQEPAGAVEAPDVPYLRHRLERSLQDLPNSLGLTLHRDFLVDVLAALTSLQPVTQAKSEAVAWQVKQKTYKDRGPWVDVDRETYESAARYPERCEVRALVPQEAVERQPLTDTEIDRVLGITAGRNVSLEMTLRSVFRAAEGAHGIGPATQEKL